MPFDGGFRAELTRSLWFTANDQKIDLIPSESDFVTDFVDVEGGGSSADVLRNGKGVDDKKRGKRLDELEQQSVDQQTEIRRLNEKMNRQSAYINELEAEKMRGNNTNLKQRMEIKKLKGRLRELEGDVEKLDNIESFLKQQESVGMEQDAAIEKVLTPSPTIDQWFVYRLTLREGVKRCLHRFVCFRQFKPPDIGSLIEICINHYQLFACVLCVMSFVYFVHYF